MSRYRRGFDVVAARRHLRRADPALGRWMRRIGSIEADPRWGKRFDVCDALARAILFQQLSGKAASTIVGRVEAAIDSRLLHADTLCRVDDEGIRRCGVSGNKLLALRDLCVHAERGAIPDLRRMSTMSEDAIVESLTAVRGIGRWTVEMMLMARLGRPDVLPIDDLGIRKGAQRVDGSDSMPTPKALLERGECWGPYRTYASFYLWRIADFESAAHKPTPRSQE